MALSRKRGARGVILGSCPRSCLSCLLCSIFALLPGSAAHGQFLPLNAQSNARYQFNFSNPGARSLGMGGAFTGLADDATAAYANPAGLTQLTRPEISWEGRNWLYEVPFISTTRVRDPNNEPRSLLRTEEDEAESSITGASFLSCAYPLDRSVLAFYRHELANFGAEAHRSTPSDDAREVSIDSVVRLRITGYGFSAAHHLTDKLSVGVSGALYDLSYHSGESFVRVTEIDPGGPLRTERGSYSQQGDEWAPGGSVGLLWQEKGRWSAGAFWRRGPAFDISEKIVKEDFVEERGAGRFRAPDVYGAGTSIIIGSHLIWMFEIDRVLYSQILGEKRVLEVTSFSPTQEFVTIGHFHIDDATEIRTGIEYTLWEREFAPTLRLGVWYNPDHQIRFDAVSERSNSFSAQRLTAEYPRGDDQVHYTAGLGILFGQRLQVDGAIDFSSAVKTLSISGVLRF